MLPHVHAERQLRAIEASLVGGGNLKPEVANRIIDRHKRSLQAPEERKPRSASEQLLDGFRQAGFPVVHEEAPSR
jgi:hypothetical protein